jgi:hypothetical protein
MQHLHIRKIFKISQKSNNNTQLQTFSHTYEQILQREKNNMRELRLLASGEIWDPNTKHEKINPISTKLELQGEPLK